MVFPPLKCFFSVNKKSKNMLGKRKQGVNIQRWINSCLLLVLSSYTYDIFQANSTAVFGGKLDHRMVRLLEEIAGGNLCFLSSF